MSVPGAAPAPPATEVRRGPGGGVQSGRRWGILAVLCISLLVVSLDSTILNVAVPDIIRSLRASTSDLQWAIDAYAVVFAGLLLVLGSLGDRVGRKWVLLVGELVFGLGSAGSALSTSPDQLIAARAFMGIGAAAIMPSTLSILINVFTEADERARAIGIWSGTTGLGVAVGPVLGGWLLAHFWWGSVFFINVPICAAGLALGMWLVPNSRDVHAKHADVVGAVLSTSGMGLLLWGIIEAPTRSWSSPLVLGAAAGGLFVLASFVAWERRTDHPMLQLALFRSRRFSAAMGAMCLVMFALMGGLFLLTQLLQFEFGYSAFGAGMRIAPIALILVVVAPLSPRLDRRFGTKPVVFTGMALMAAGFGLLSSTSVHGTYLDTFPALALMGLGVGLAFAPATEAVMGAVPLAEAGVGSATNSAALQVGGATGVAVLGSLLNARYRGNLTPILAGRAMPSEVHSLILGSLGGALAVAHAVGGALGPVLASTARLAFVNGMDLAVVVAALVVGAAAFVVVAALPDRPPPAADVAARADGHGAGGAPASAPPGKGASKAGPTEAGGPEGGPPEGDATDGGQ
jgi:EmrB/QacA subfamily drug resistance transporter